MSNGVARERNLIPSPYVQKSVTDKRKPNVMQRKATAQSKKCQLEDKQNKSKHARQLETLVVMAKRNKNFNSIPCPTLSLLTLP